MCRSSAGSETSARSARYVEAVLALPSVEREWAPAPVHVRERAGQTKAHYEPATTTIAVPLKTQWAARESVHPA